MVEKYLSTSSSQSSSTSSALSHRFNATIAAPANFRKMGRPNINCTEKEKRLCQSASHREDEEPHQGQFPICPLLAGIGAYSYVSVLV